MVGGDAVEAARPFRGSGSRPCSQPVVVLDPHVDGGADPREGVDHESMRARSQSPTTWRVLIESRSLRASSERTGVLPTLTTCLGPRTEEDGLRGTTCPTGCGETRASTNYRQLFP